MIAYSYMGGLDGLAVTRRCLAQITWNCTLYLIVMGKEGLESIAKEVADSSVLHKQYTFKTDFAVMQYAQFYNEHLYVIRLRLEVLGVV